MLLFSIKVYSQTRVVKGTVSEKGGDPIVGASVVIKGENQGTVTDIDGAFIIKVPEKAKTIIFQYLGYRTQEKPISSVMKVELEEDAVSLQETVVIGYGTSKRADLTGSVSSIGENVLKDIPVSNAMDAIAGRMAGVSIVRAEGSPDSEFAITVRGGGSITQDNTPLFIVDGFQVSDIKDIPPRDILTIDVLKDASSTAIYGSQGANGVIVITTKSGQAGRTNISFNTQVGFKQVYNLTEVLSPYEFVYYQKELDPTPTAGFFSNYGLWEDINIYKSMQGSDWQTQLYGNTGLEQSHNVTISGGEKSFRFNLSYTHDDEDYIMTTSNFKRDNLSLKLNKDINKNLSFDFSAKLTSRTVFGPSVSNGKKLREAVKYAPVKTLNDLSAEDLLDGTTDENSTEAMGGINNPVANIEKNYSKQRYFNQSYNAGLTWKIVKGLTFRTQGTFAFNKDNKYDIATSGTSESSANGGRPVAKRYDYVGERWQWQNTITYDKTIQKRHKMNFMLGQDVSHNRNNELYSYAKFFPSDFTANDVMAKWSYGEFSSTFTTLGEPIRTFSYFGRVNYTFDERYLLTFTAREDGKNVFAPGKRWGFFPGGAVAWRISQEQFMASQKSWLSNLKLRLSYGSVGNARVNPTWRQDYETESSINKMFYPNEIAANVLRPTSTMYNENLTWETKISLNGGLDFGFFNERLSGTVDIYKETTKDLIMNVQIPSHSGYTSQYQNVGQISNRGVEIALNGQLIQKRDFQLGASFNIAFNKNRIDAIDNKGGSFNEQSSGIKWDYGLNEFLVEVGQPLGVMYGFVADGFYSFDDFTWNSGTKSWDLKDGVVDISTLANTGSYFGPGHMKLKDLDGDGKITLDGDRTKLGTAQPKFKGGFSFNTSWKGFDASVLFNFTYGNKILNGNRVDNTTYVGSKKYQNLSTEMALSKRFTTIDPETGLNIYYGTYADPERLEELNRDATIWHPLLNRTIFSSWVVEDGSFLRLSNLSVGYTLPGEITKKLMIQKLRFYVTGNNLYCWTKYTGQDPEVSVNSKNPMTQGVDNNVYPKSRSFVFGANITF